MVFLDLRRNQYLCLSRHNTQTAIDLMADFTVPGTSVLETTSVTDVDEVHPVLQALTARGLLTQSGPSGRGTSVIRMRTPEHALIADISGAMSAVHFNHRVFFLNASLNASRKLRWLSMQRTVQSVEKRKQRPISPQPIDYNSFRDFIAIFHRLRPLYPRKYLCLYDCLALIEFLAHYRLFPQWVFGVKAEPFAAHCWLQEADLVLNDSVEFVRGFTPIMAV